MLNYKLKIGLLPIRRNIKEPPKRIGIFQSDYAVENKNNAIKFIRENYEDANTQFVDLEWLNEEGLLRLDSDCDKVAEYFKQEKIDALFIINCNFLCKYIIRWIVCKRKFIRTWKIPITNKHRIKHFIKSMLP